MTARSTVWDWVQSDDAICVPEATSTNGYDRGDGYDVSTWRSVSTGRYLVCDYKISARMVCWYVAWTLDAAFAIGRAGYTPGSAPGRYTRVWRPSRLAEVRATKVVAP